MEKTKVIFIYGTPAVGKLTTAKLLAEKKGYKLLHNHLTTDLVRAIFDRGSDVGGMLILKLRLDMLEIAVKEKVKGVVVTGVYAKDYTYPNGKTDEWYVQEIEKITNENGGEFYGVNLVAHKDALMERVGREDRRMWKKINTGEVLEDLLGKYDFTPVAPVKNNIVIDNTDLSVEQSVEKIIKFIS
jgi:hypothetical protein